MMRRVPAWLVGLAWVSPWMIGFLWFLAVPVAMSLYYSFTDYSLIEGPVPVGAANYREMMGDSLFWASMRNTLLYTFVSVAVGGVMSIAIAVLLEQKLRGTAIVRAVVFFPTLVPIVAAAIGWRYLFQTENGLINVALGVFGLPAMDWLGDPRAALWAMVLMGLWFYGTAVVIYTAALRDVPRSLYEAAAMDGLGAWRRFVSVTLPSISPAVLFNTVITTIWSLQIFAAPLLMTRGGPDNATMVFSLYVYRNAFEYGRMGYASALAWVQILIAVVLTVVALGLSKRLTYYRAA
jgi:multiple sugar transport system permease protein